MAKDLLKRIENESIVVRKMNSVLIKEVESLSQKVKEMNIRLLEMNADLERAKTIRDLLESYE
jgi:hypothetical protein